MKLIHSFLFHKKNQEKKIGYKTVEWLGLFKFSTISPSLVFHFSSPKKITLVRENIQPDLSKIRANFVPSKKAGKHGENLLSKPVKLSNLRGG